MDRKSASVMEVLVKAHATVADQDAMSLRLARISELL